MSAGMEMTHEPLIPEGFKALSLEDREAVAGVWREDPPQTSELTFTNLFMWRGHYQPAWRMENDCLLVVASPAGRPPFGLPPHGRGDKARAVERLLEVTAPGGRPAVERAGRDLVDLLADSQRYRSEPDPDQNDYVYLTESLISLSGRKMHQKKNHLNQFIKNNDFECRRLEAELIASVLELQESWCEMRACAQDPGLASEDRAVYEALENFDRLSCEGLAIIIDGRVEAFALGEPLNPDTAVIHVEKANPEFRGLYAAINQRFCQEFFADRLYVNREQDLGSEGLRQAKQSYHPHHLVEKYVIQPA